MVFTPIQNWDQIAQQNIFPGESGGDYNALFGFSNRPGGRFEHIQPTRMTVGQMADFTSPKGEYAQWVKSQIGRVATPTGAYQAVGTTMRAAIDALGLDPNTPYDKNTQDMIGQWIYANQGPGAWEGWGKGSSGGDQHGPITASTKGGGDMNPLAYMMGGQDFPMFDPGPTKGDRWRGGLVAAGEALTSLGAGRGSNFEQTDAFLRGEMARRMAQHNAQGEYGARQDATAQAEAGRNATAQWLATQGPKGEALAQAVLSGAMDGASAVAALTDPKAVLPGLAGAEGGAVLTDEQLGHINTLRDDIRTDTGAFRDTQTAAEGIFSAAKGTGGLTDMTMAQQFQKLLDPTSVVREGELDMVMTSGGTMAGMVAKMMGELKANGGKLTDATKQEIMRLTKDIVDIRRKSSEEQRGIYRKTAERAGIDPELLDLGALPELQMPEFKTSLDFGPGITLAQPGLPQPDIFQKLPSDAQSMLKGAMIGNQRSKEQFDVWLDENLGQRDQKAIADWLTAQGLL